MWIKQKGGGGRGRRRGMGGKKGDTENQRGGGRERQANLGIDHHCCHPCRYFQKWSVLSNNRENLNCSFTCGKSNGIRTKRLPEGNATCWGLHCALLPPPPPPLRVIPLSVPSSLWALCSLMEGWMEWFYFFRK